MSSTPPPRVAVVTGANKGIGLAIGTAPLPPLSVHLSISPPLPSSPPPIPQPPVLHLSLPPFLPYTHANPPPKSATSPSPTPPPPSHKTTPTPPSSSISQPGIPRGATQPSSSSAATRNSATPRRSRTTAVSHRSPSTLDVTSEASITAFAAFLEKEHGSVDVVVGNAGIWVPGEDAPAARATLAVNYHGLLRTHLALLPLLPPQGRLVTVSSVLGALGYYPAPLAARFRDATSHAQISQLMEEYVEAAGAGTARQKGWVRSPYDHGKAGATGATRCLALEVRGREEGEGGRKGEGGVLVNSCCPGYVRTDLSPGGVKSPDEGARTPVLLALGDIGGRTGLFWKDEVVVEW